MSPLAEVVTELPRRLPLPIFTLAADLSEFGRAVAFGCTVTLRLNGQPRTITLVGDDEADPAAGLLSFSAPLSRAIIDAEPGEVIDFAGRADAIVIEAIAVDGD